jgi:hypothetical protein
MSVVELQESYAEPENDEELIVHNMYFSGSATTIAECARQMGLSEAHILGVLTRHFRRVSGKLDKIETVLDHN